MMNRRTFLAGAAALAFAPRALAQAGMADPWYNTLLTDRGRYARAIHLYGDSILRGYALHVFADQADASGPLYDFRSPASMANLALTEAGLPHVVAYGGAAVSYPETLPLIAERVAAGVIRSGDVVVLEDAGDHGTDPDAYQAQMLEVRRVASQRHDITVVMMTMWDYSDGANLASNPDYQYDTACGARTFNDAIRAAATEDKPYVGQTILLDMNTSMDNWRLSAQSIDGVAVIHSDGIHPNIWGQMRLTGEILKAAGLRPYLRTVDRAVALARANYQALAYGSATFTASRAEAYTRACLLR